MSRRLPDSARHPERSIELRTDEYLSEPPSFEQHERA